VYQLPVTFTVELIVEASVPQGGDV
jgi:hypothetical protein